MTINYSNVCGVSIINNNMENISMQLTMSCNCVGIIYNWFDHDNQNNHNQLNLALSSDEHNVLLLNKITEYFPHMSNCNFYSFVIDENQFDNILFLLKQKTFTHINFIININKDASTNIINIDGINK